MRVSHDKIGRLSHVATDALAAVKDVKFNEEHNAVRLQARRILEDLLRTEARMDEEVRRKIGSQKKGILEGSSEWDVLYRKYYQEELKKLGV